VSSQIQVCTGARRVIAASAYRTAIRRTWVSGQGASATKFCRRRCRLSTSAGSSVSEAAMGSSDLRSNSLIRPMA
jgi:hypothetical protein